MYTELWVIGTNIGVAVGTIFLAIVALISLLQVRSRQRKEIINRAKDDIKEWAQDIADFSIAPSLKFAIIEDSKERQTMEHIYWLEFLDSKERMGKRIKSRAQALDDATILRSIQDLVEEIKKTNSLLLERDSPPLIYTANEFLQVGNLNNKAIELINKLDAYRA